MFFESGLSCNLKLLFLSFEVFQLFLNIHYSLLGWCVGHFVFAHIEVYTWITLVRCRSLVNHLNDLRMVQRLFAFLLIMVLVHPWWQFVRRWRIFSYMVWSGFKSYATVWGSVESLEGRHLRGTVLVLLDLLEQLNFLQVLLLLIRRVQLICTWITSRSARFKSLSWPNLFESIIFWTLWRVHLLGSLI